MIWQQIFMLCQEILFVYSAVYVNYCTVHNNTALYSFVAFTLIIGKRKKESSKKEKQEMKQQMADAGSQPDSALRSNKQTHTYPFRCCLLQPSPCELLCSVQVHSITRHEGAEGDNTHSSTLSLTSALGGNGWSTPRPGRYTPVPNGQEAGRGSGARLDG